MRSSVARICILLGGSILAIAEIAACGGNVDSISGSEDDAGLEQDARVSVDGSFVLDGAVVIVDASVEDSGKRRRDGGVVEDAGAFDAGSVFDASEPPEGGDILDAGSAPDAKAPDGDGGPQGPRDAGPLTGPLLRDGNGVVLGELISVQPEDALYTIVTSTDYVVVLNFDGTYEDQTFYYNQPACGGTVFLGAGCSGARSLLGNTVVFCAQTNSLMIPAGPLFNGAETSQSVNLVTASGNSFGCLDQGAATCQGWPLTPTTAANVGLPDTIVPPLSYP